jgi:phospholipase C
VAGNDGAHRFDHVVSVMFENRSFDNLLGYLYDPGEVASFEGVAGRELSNPIPSYAPGAERGVVPVHVATSMDAPNPTRARSTPTPTPSCTGPSHQQPTGSCPTRRCSRRSTPLTTRAVSRPWTASSSTT